MELGQILNIGIGRCGNCLVDALVAKSTRYTGMLINSSATDLDDLEFIIGERGGWHLFPDTDGAGRDQSIAHKYVVRNRMNLKAKLNKYVQCTTFMIYFSADGGTGSGGFPELTRIIKGMHEGEDIHIGAVITMHSKAENTDKVQLKNMKNTWQQVKMLREKGILNSVFIIDNDTRDTLAEINSEAIRYLDAYYRMNELDASATVDETDLERLTNVDGYKFIFSLNNKKDNIAEAIQDGINKSVFLKPDKYVSLEKTKDAILSNFHLSDENKEKMLEAEEDYIYKCGKSILLLQPNRFEPLEVKKLFKSGGSFIGEFDNNLIAMSGMDIPEYKIKEVQGLLSLSMLEDELHETKEMMSFGDDFDFEHEKPVSQKPKRVRLKAVMDDDNWN